MEVNRKEAYFPDSYAIWEKYGEEYYGISMDRIVKGQHIKYLKDAVEYFRQKHG